MFYDESAKVRSPMSKSAKRTRRMKRFRFTMTGVMIVLLPPFLMLAIVPTMLMFVPVALVLIPFMLAALVSAHAKQSEPQLIPIQRLPRGAASAV